MSTALASSTLSQALQRLLPVKKTALPPVLKASTGNLYEVLSRTPTGGIGAEVHQLRWSKKQIPDSYWVVTRSRFKCDGKHGKAWGRLYWKGVLVSAREEQIRGSLKYTWKDGRSKPEMTSSSTQESTQQNLQAESP
ncbi:hypothetical protein B0H34DRAFT_687602 [Crassisporium funariophilum]|nr:hypothetical protein B0H34DRAFT_687602 [Crassisporium funariophilum]